MRKMNFNPGPAVLPFEVLEEQKNQFYSHYSEGMSIKEMSHRSPAFMSIIQEAESNLRKLLQINDDYHVLFLQGGASWQFTMIPFNLAEPGSAVEIVNTGEWANKAIQSHQEFIEFETVVINYGQFPFCVYYPVSKGRVSYLHITSNETINGIRWPLFPETGEIPLVADMSSDIMSRPVDVSKFGLIYAGAQKNLGEAGVTLVIIRKDLAEKKGLNPKKIMSYRTHVKAGSLYNTPSTSAIFTLMLVTRWIIQQGGIAHFEQLSRYKASMLYKEIGLSDGFYQNKIMTEVWSLVNVVFTLPNDELTKKFLQEAEQEGFVGLKGHRLVGGIRASLYNAIPEEWVKALAEFMSDFCKENQ